MQWKTVFNPIVHRWVRTQRYSGPSIHCMKSIFSLAHIQTQTERKKERLESFLKRVHTSMYNTHKPAHIHTHGHSIDIRARSHRSNVWLSHIRICFFSRSVLSVKQWKRRRIQKSFYKENIQFYISNVSKNQPVHGWQIMDFYFIHTRITFVQ